MTNNSYLETSIFNTDVTVPLIEILEETEVFPWELDDPFEGVVLSDDEEFMAELARLMPDPPEIATYGAYYQNDDNLDKVIAKARKAFPSVYIEKEILEMDTCYLFIESLACDKPKILQILGKSL